VTAFADAIRGADGVVIVSPEYNFSVPGGLKNAFDWVSRLKEQPFVDKPVALMSASGGPVGGARMQYHMRQIMVFLNARVFNTPEVFVGMAPSKIDEKGEITDQPTKDFITKQLSGSRAAAPDLPTYCSPQRSRLQESLWIVHNPEGTCKRPPSQPSGSAAFCLTVRAFHDSSFLWRSSSWLRGQRAFRAWRAR
jgi:hypothetical protein